jgi:hypothetical protein
MDAAKWYQQANQERKKLLYDTIYNTKDEKSTSQSSSLEHRIDLTKLPSVCIDNIKASFRDDAIGIRPRKATGRHVISNNKWEILVHIADVSELYVPTTTTSSTTTTPISLLQDHPQREEHIQTLQTAASNRGTSRYDLPDGPLHMLPRPLLESLSIDVFKPDWTSSVGLTKQWKHSNHKSQTVNRCVTMWMYIDEETGQLLDTGIERTIIAAPLALSFETATSLMKQDDEDEDDHDPTKANIRSMLKIIERSVTKWKKYRQSSSTTSQAREERLSAYEEISRQIDGDESGGGYRRTRAHRLVDGANDLYGYAMLRLIRPSKGNLPFVVGARDGRIGTGPLRRYIDGVAQRQALSILCQGNEEDFGRPMSKQECAELGKQTTEALNRINNLNAAKRTTTKVGLSSNNKIGVSSAQQMKAAQMLQIQLKNGNNGHGHLLPAITTGSGSDVIISGVGAVATCKNMNGTMKPGQKINVSIDEIDTATGKVMAIIATTTSGGTSKRSSSDNVKRRSTSSSVDCNY